MKKIYQLCLIVYILLNQNLYAQRQMNYWALPPYKIDFTGASPTTTVFQHGLPQFHGLCDVAMDPSGYIIVAGFEDHSIRRVSTSGDVTTIGGTGVSGFINGYQGETKFSFPTGVVVDASGNVYVMDSGNNCIRKIPTSGVSTTIAGNGSAGYVNGTGSAARFNGAYGMTIDPSGNLYVADGNNHAIRKITPAGVVTTFAGNGTAGSADGTGTAARFYQPRDVAADASGNIYVTDNYNHTIRKITPAGVVTTIAGTAGSAGLVNGTGAAARFDKPWGIAVDGSSNLYVSDATNGVIRKITSAGVVTTYAGTGTPGFADGPAASAKFQWPCGLTLDGSGNLYVADNETHRVRKISTAGVVSTVAGNGIPGFVDTEWDFGYAASNGAYDENGNILFVVKDNDIYNASGVSIGTLANYLDVIPGTGSYMYDGLGKEISIVPVPGTCRDFYIIYLKYGFSQWHQGVKLLYSKVSVSLTGVVTILSNGTLIGGVGGNFMCFAVSKLNQDGVTRFIYSLGTTSAAKYTISSSGISSGTTLAGITSNGAKVLELNSTGSRLAWIDKSGSNAVIHICNPDDLSQITKTISTISGTFCSGLEFSPDDNYIYFSANAGTSLRGIFKVPATGVSGTVTPVQITTGQYGSTELELASDGFIYAIDGTPASSSSGLVYGTLGRINPSTDAVTSFGSILIPSSRNVGLLHGEFYALPDQIDGENYNYFFGTAKLSSTFTINSAAVSPTTAVNTFTCSSILLNNTASSATAYQITINSADAAGNIVAGYSYTTGLIGSAPAASIDIKSLNSNYLATHPGYYKIQFYTQNTCSSQTSVGLIQNSTITAASANFKLNDGLGNFTNPNNTLPGDAVSAYGVSLSGSYSTGYVSNYQIKVDQVDCSTGTVLTANIINTPSTAVTGGNPSTISAVALNSKSSPLGYFMSHAGCFKISYTVTNACGTSTQTGYFNSDPAVFRLAGVSTNLYNATAVYPNPSNGITNVVFTSDESKIVKCTLNNLQGGASYTAFENQSVSAGINEVSFDTSALPAGLYLYELTDDTNTIQTGKLVITK